MKMEYVHTIITFLGGIGMFLYGMSVMAEGIQKSAGDKMKNFLRIITSNRILAVLVGAGITAIIQSSAATTVMVVGFVNAGIMNLSQAIGVIMGANIGTTATSWLVSMSEWGSFLKPDAIAPVFVGVSAFVILISKNEKKKNIASILFGFGILFIGLSTMSGAITVYQDSPIFVKVFKTFGSNPILGILAGTVVTAIIQSSSASVGILQTMAMNGFVTWNSAIYITLGQNIGTCITALLSSAGTHKTAKRAAIMHLLFNVIGACIFGVAMMIIFKLNPVFASSTISSVDISVFHTIFNVTCTIVLLPFGDLIVKLSGLLIRTSETDDDDNDVVIAKRHLDKRILETPSFAIEEASIEVVHMGEVAYETAKLAFDAIIARDVEKAERVYAKENSIDEMTDLISEYLVKISSLPLNEEQHNTVTNLFYTVSNFERMGDHSENIAELCKYMVDNNITFSEPAVKELEGIMEIVTNSFVYAIRSRRDLSADSARRAKEYEELVDKIEDDLRKKHMKRLANELCKPTSGVVFLNILTNLERISDHADNVAGYVLDELQ